MSKSTTEKTAAALTAVAFMFIVIAFITTNWLETDDKSEQKDIVKLGLWQVCFRGFQDPEQVYQARLYGCWWIWEEDYYIIHDMILHNFFVATKIFFALCLTLLLVGVFLTALYTCCSDRHEKYKLLLWATGANITLSGLCGIVAVIIFGATGDWERNDISWSYPLAAVGSLILVIAGILFLVEAKRHRLKTDEIPWKKMNTHTTI